jgi:hypothetical protein
MYGSVFSMIQWPHKNVCSFIIYHNLWLFQSRQNQPMITQVDDLGIVLSRFLFFLVSRQDSFSIPSVEDSCLKKQILTFWQDPCRPNLGWRGKKSFARQDSCILQFLSNSLFSWLSCLILLLAILAWLFFLVILV